jgi:hypothetical protein
LKEVFNNLVFHHDSNPYGVPFAKWTGKWWRWIRSIPRDTNPALDTTGQYCDVSQPYPNVWFLAGTFGGSVTRYCTIPYGNALLFPIITSVFSFVEDPDLKSEEDLLNAARNDTDTVKQLNFTVDDIKFGQLDQFRVSSGIFDDIVDGVQTKLVSDGFWIFLRPPQMGRHTIYFVGENIDFFNQVTYNLSID